MPKAGSVNLAFDLCTYTLSFILLLPVVKSFPQKGCDPGSGFLLLPCCRCQRDLWQVQDEKNKGFRGILSAVFSELGWRTKHSLHLQFKSPQSKSQQLLSQRSPCCDLLSATPDRPFWAGPVGKGHSKSVSPTRNNLHVKMVHFPKLTVATLCISEASTDIKQQCASVEQGHSCRKLLSCVIGVGSDAPASSAALQNMNWPLLRHLSDGPEDNFCMWGILLGCMVGTAWFRK